MNYKVLPTLTDDDDQEIDPKKGVKKQIKMNLPTLYRCKDGRVDVMNIWSEGDKWFSCWGIKGMTMQKSERQGEIKNGDKVNALSAEEDALYQAYSHWAKAQKKSGYDVDLQDVEKQFPLIAMTAYDVKKREKQKRGFDWDKKYILQPKLDGHRMTSGVDPDDGELVLVSRSRDEVKHVKHIREELKIFHEQFGRVYLDGELYAHGISRQKISSMVRKKNDPHPDEKKVIYYVFDCYFPDEPEMPYRKRIRFLRENVKDMKYVQVLETVTSDGTKKFIDEFFQKCMNDGMEGIMIKMKKSIYKPGKRSMDVLKMKSENHMDCLIVGFTEGTGSHKGLIVFECITKDEKRFRSVPAWTHEKRAKAFKKGDKYIGRIADISYFSKSLDGVPDFNILRDIKD